MATISSDSGPDQGSKDHQNCQARVVRAALLAAGGFGSTVVTLVMVAGQWEIQDATIRYTTTVIAGVVALALFVAAIFVWPRK